MTGNNAPYGEARQYQPFIYLIFFVCAWGPLGQSHAAEACEPWVAKIESLQGQVEVIRAGKTRWRRVSLKETFCPGDRVRIEAHSRAAIALRNKTFLRLKAGTTITFEEFEPDKPSLLEILKGAVHFISRVPRTLKIKTPFVNAAIEGTELLVRVESTETAVWVFEGQILVSNAAGSLRLSSGQGATAEAGKAPTRRLIIKPRNAVQWALYYPPIINSKSLMKASGRGAKVIQEALRLYRVNELPDAIAALNALPATDRDTQFHTLRAGLLLSVGGVDEARKDIARALILDSDDGIAHALQAIIALAQNEKEKSLQLAQQAVTLNPRSPVPQIALSYAHQALFDIEKARKSVKRAISLDPDDALAWARLSELELSLGYLDRALAAARNAVDLDPNLERTQTVLGFARLTQIEISGARKAFRKAIRLDSTAPLPRLGLGLTTIRRGDLRDGTREIEIAASLDPNNSLIRSYLGKAYFEQRREKLAATEFAIAKQLDPNDPTPYFYDAILKQTTNRPVEALRDLQKAIELNDNRAVYRSRLLLDQDAASRGTSLARIFNDLGFERVAEVEATKSLSIDPSNHSAHRFLADTYAQRTGFEIASVSELLQAQLLQPININPVQPQLTVTDLSIISRSGPAKVAFNEFTPLFERNGAQLIATGAGGNNDTVGGEGVLSGLYNRLSFSGGHFYTSSDGFRKNNDLKHHISNAYAQVAVTPRINIQAEYRRRETRRGDRELNFDQSFSDSLRFKLDQDVVRFGARFSPSPRADLLFSLFYTDLDQQLRQNLTFFDLDRSVSEDGYQGEGQFLFHTQNLNLTMGGGLYDIDVRDRTTTTFPFRQAQSTNSFNRIQKNAYIYTNASAPKNATWTLGLSYDDYDGRSLNREKLSPKFGLQWDITPKIRLRLAALQTIKRALVVDQTIEPTQVAGFNQFFDDFNGTKAQQYSAAVDANLKNSLFGGFEISHRDLDVPTEDAVDDNTTFQNQNDDLYRLYVYWPFHERWAIRSEFLKERFKRPDGDPRRLDTTIVPISLRYFHPTGLFAGLRTTYLRQDIDYSTQGRRGDEENVGLLDFAFGYRFPKRYGIFRLEVRNVFDKDFHYQDRSFRTPTSRVDNPRFIPERQILGRVTINF